MISENDRKIPEAISQYESSFKSDPTDLSTIRYLENCPAEVLISAAKSLAEAYSSLGDNRNAYTFMNITISLAKNQNSSQDYIKNLEEKLRQYSPSN